MQPDDNICYCFHVPFRKLLHFARRERLQRASQMSQCLGAGTGCGWCIPILKKIYEQSRPEHDPAVLDSQIGLPNDSKTYAAGRKEYLRSSEKNTFE